ncbi:MAG: hypothetical protein M3354_09505 [Chloroflexota bacterium]|nr:hypothetical protein [Chloroflexota bacterium]
MIAGSMYSRAIVFALLRPQPSIQRSSMKPQNVPRDDGHYQRFGNNRRAPLTIEAAAVDTVSIERRLMLRRGGDY